MRSVNVRIVWRKLNDGYNAAQTEPPFSNQPSFLSSAKTCIHAHRQIGPPNCGLHATSRLRLDDRRYGHSFHATRGHASCRSSITKAWSASPL